MESKKPSYWGKLKKGIYSCGFRRIYAKDYSRTYNIKSSLSPRPVIINIWYPSLNKQKHKMKIRDLINFDDCPKDFDLFAEEVTKNQFRLAKFYTYGIYIDNDLDPYSNIENWNIKISENFELYYNLSVDSLRDVPVCRGKYPLIVYHQGLGGTIDDAFLFCEYMASQGFIAANAVYQSNDINYAGVDWDLDRSIAEINFLINYICNNIPEVDQQKIIGAGHSFGAQVMLAYAVRKTSPMIGYIILDSTIDYEDTYKLKSFRKLTDNLNKNHKNIIRPMLIAARGDATFRICNTFINSERYYLKFRGMEHNDFTSQSAIAKHLITKDNENAASLNSVFRNYITLVKVCHDFIKSLTKNRKFIIDAEHYKKLRTSYGISLTKKVNPR